MRWQSRDVCAVLEDIEKSHETRNFSVIPGLVAEARILSSRVENILELERTLERLMESIESLEKKRDKLRKEVGIEYE